MPPTRCSTTRARAPTQPLKTPERWPTHWPRPARSRRHWPCSRQPASPSPTSCSASPARAGAKKRSTTSSRARSQSPSSPPPWHRPEPMSLHPEIARILGTLPPPPPGPLNPEAMRAGEAAQVPPLEDRLPLHAVEDATAVTPAGDVPIRIYTPVDTDAYGLLVYFHGGAFF